MSIIVADQLPSLSVHQCTLRFHGNFHEILQELILQVSQFHLSFFRLSHDPRKGLPYGSCLCDPLRALEALGEQQFIGVFATQYRHERGLAALALQHWPSIGQAFLNMDEHG